MRPAADPLQPAPDPGPAPALAPRPLLRQKIRRKHLAPAAGVLAVAAAAEPTLASSAVGLPLVAAGMALRTWAAGHLVKTKELATTGPYTYLRHPLYLGTLLVVAGGLLAAGWKVAALVIPPFLGVFFLQYLPRKELREGRRLARRHGARFEAYRARVRPLLPSVRGAPSLEAPAPLPAPGAPARAVSAVGRWRAARFRANNELGVWIGLLAALAALYALPLLG